LKIRFQADADLRRPIITGLKRREPGIDFKTALEAGLAGLDDSAVLGIASADGRVLVTHDVSTMPEEFTSFIETRISPGVILVSQSLSYHDAIGRLHRVWATSEAEDWENVLSFLPS
jgi:uncharacterized protein DUF5615